MIRFRHLVTERDDMNSGGGAESLRRRLQGKRLAAAAAVALQLQGRRPAVAVCVGEGWREGKQRLRDRLG